MSIEEITFAGACEVLESTLNGPARRQILQGILESRGSKPLPRLRYFIKSNTFKAGATPISLDRFVRRFDGRTRKDGFNVLHDWDGAADKFNPEIIPVDVINFLMRTRDPGDRVREVLAILLDYYFFHLLCLLSLRAWDGDRPDDDLDRVNRLLQALQGQKGSGQKFAANAETLVLLATSHFEGEDAAYDRLLDKVRALNESHRLNFALVYAGVLASHLRFGFEAAYGRDVAKMRDDNAVDYPWLCFSLLTLMKAFSRLSSGDERDRVVESVLNGLSPDPAAFLGDPPDSLSGWQAECAELSGLLAGQARDLLRESEHHRPSNLRYSPVALFFNFPHNVLKGTVIDALLRGVPWDITLNDLFTAFPRTEALERSRRTLAETLMGYARSSPDPYRGRLVPSIVYDPALGRRVFSKTIARLPS